MLFYLSGHGTKDRDGKQYFVATDTHTDMLMSTGLSATYILEASEHSRCRRQVFFFDACFSAAFARGYTHKSDSSVHLKEAFTSGTGKIIITATDELQYASLDNEINDNGAASVFTKHLVECLRTGAATNADGDITVEGLYQYIFERVQEENPAQKPQLWCFGLSGGLVLAHNQTLKPSLLEDSSIDNLDPDTPEMCRYLGEVILKSGNVGKAVSFFEKAIELKADYHTAWSYPLQKLVTVDLPSTSSVDYTRLRSLLAAGKWKLADRETFELMCQVSNRAAAESLNLVDIRNFPSKDLRTIDQLWVKYSDGHFGFSVQREIFEWNNCGSGQSKEYLEDIDERLRKFGTAIGWCASSWLDDYSSLTFDLSAPKGHLPGWGIIGDNGWGGWGLFRGGTGYVLLSRKDLTP